MTAVLTPGRQGWLVGHEAAEATLVAETAAGRLHHAWLITGPQGIGKATLAFRFARWLLAGCPGTGLSVSDADPVSRRIAAGTHADLLAVGPSFDEKRQRHRTEIVADDVRPVGDFLRRTAAEGGWRVVILDGADLLNRHAANALLKILEEPPPRAVLLLVSSSPGRLLPTLRSRCRLLRLVPLDQAPMKLALERLLPDEDEADRLVLAGLARGAPGRAVSLAAENGVAIADLVRDLLQGGTSGAAAYEVADRVLRKEQGFATFLTLLLDAMSERVRSTARCAGVGATSGTDWLGAWQVIGRLRAETERFNLDKRQALLSSLDLLSER